jgi:hypothetical protein
MARFLDVLPGPAAGRPIQVLDIGGTRTYWESMVDLWSHIPMKFTIVNLGQEPNDDGIYSLRPGNACDLSEYGDNQFDIVHSNSVIEHVGHWPQMQAMAREVSRLAPKYFLQTPNFWFPMEPHYRTLGFQWWPETVRARMLCQKKRGFHARKASIDAAMRDVQSVNLLDAPQLRALFPEAEILKERVLGLTKSIIAVRR